MRWLNHLCGVAATLASCAAPLSAQEIGDPPAPQAAMAAYRAVDGWVRAWHVGKVEHFRPEDPQVPTCIAASVTLRLGGEVIGRGVEVAADDAARQSIVAAATRAALAEAEPRLGVPRDAMYETTVMDLAKRITISIQLAGDLIPISPKDAAEALDTVAPGVEGVAVRLGDRIAANFPERMLASGTEPGPALGTLVARLADDPTLSVLPLSKLAKDNGAVFYRFRVTHLAQVRAGDTPVFLFRCGSVVPRAAMNAQELKRWADAMAAHLCSAPPPSDLPVRPVPGSLNPIRAERDADLGITASAIVAAALIGYSSTPGIVEPDGRRAVNAGEAILAGLCIKYENGSKEIEPVAAGATQWAMHQFRCATGGTGGSTSMFDVVADISEFEIWGEWIDAGRNPDGDMQHAFKPRQWPEATWRSPGAGMIVAGMAVSHPEMKAYGMPDALEVARTSLKRAYLGTAPPELVSQMPWLGWAQLALEPAGEVSTAIVLRELRAQVWQHQLQPDSLSADQQDLSGGVVLTASRQPMPTWQMARPLAFVATMLGDPRLTGDNEVAEELSRLLLSLRFLRQLTAGEAEGFMYRNPEQAIGGVRSSLWDQRMPPEATAMTLMTVCETLRSMEEIRKRREAR